MLFGRVASVAVAMEALKQARLAPTLISWAGSRSGLIEDAVAVPLPGTDAQAVVRVIQLIPDAAEGTWRPIRGQHGTSAIAGYVVGLHERPFRTRGHPYADAAEYRYSPFIDDVAADVKEWLCWEQAWSVVPAWDPTGRLRFLRRLAASRVASAALPVDVDIDPAMRMLLDFYQARALDEAIDELFMAGIRWRFPRDRTGARLANRTEVLLHQIAPPTHPMGRGIWLTVKGPQPRSEPRLTVRLAVVRGLGAYHRWDRVPEYWRRTATRPVSELWGIDAETPATMVDDLVAMLETGQGVKVLERCGIEVDATAGRLLAGLPDSYELREYTSRWVTGITGLIARSAPWTWDRALRQRDRPQRLESLGGFNPNRRPGVFVDLHRGRPRLSFDKSASPLILPRVLWERDTDHDLVRHGLITPGQIPSPSR